MASLEEGMHGRSARHSQLSGRLAGVPQHFLELLPQCLAIDASLFQDCMESFSGAAFQIQIQEVFVQKAVDGAEEGHQSNYPHQGFWKANHDICPALSQSMRLCQVINFIVRTKNYKNEMQ